MKKPIRFIIGHHYHGKCFIAILNVQGKTEIKRRMDADVGELMSNEYEYYARQLAYDIDDEFGIDATAGLIDRANWEDVTFYLPGINDENTNTTTFNSPAV